MDRSWIGLTLLALIGALELGCGTPCQNARARIDSRYAECKVEPSVPADPPENEVCSDADGEVQKCIADCTESSSCEALTGEDTQGFDDLLACYEDCSG